MGLDLPNRSLIESIDQGLWLIDSEGVTLFANSRLLQMLGMTVSEMNRKRIFDFLAADQYELVREKLTRVFGGSRETFAVPFLGSAGREVLCRVQITPADDARALAALTELGPFEKELLDVGRAQGRRESEKLAEINRAIASSLKMEDVTSAICRAARHLTGADGATFIFQENESVHYADEDAIAPLWKGRRFPQRNCISGWAILHRMPAVIEDIYQDSRIPIDAYRRTFVKSLAIMPGRPGFTVGAIGVYWARQHKATEHELALLGALVDAADVALVNAQLYEESQAARRQSEAAEKELRATNRQKDEFLGTLSHELRTPLHVILGWSRQIRKMEMPPLAAHAAEIIERNAILQARLMEDLLDVSRIINGKFKMDLRRTDVSRTIRGVLEVLEPTALAKQVQLRAELPQEAGVWGDPERLQQVFWNLLSNGVKFTPPGGCVNVRLERANGHVEIRVSDTGEGIDPELLPYLFERFRQGDGSTARKHGGLGLGLALVRHLVELHGGKVRAESPGKNLGALFVVTLPTTSESTKA